MKPQKSNIQIYQGTTYSRTFNFTEGALNPVESIITGSNTRVNLKGNHSYSVGDYAYVFNADITPSLTEAYRVVNVPENNSIVLDVSTELVRDISKAKVQRGTNLTGANFKGTIKQRNVTTLGNVLASTRFNSQRVILTSVASLNVGDRISINDAGLVDEEIIGIEYLSSPRGPYQILTILNPASSDAENAVIENFSVELALFQFDTELIKGKVKAIVSAENTSNLLPTNKGKYYYDIKYKVGEEVFTLMYGEVIVIPEITNISAF